MAFHNLSVYPRSDLEANMLAYAKEDAGALMVETGTPMSGFAASEKSMVNAFLDYVEGQNGAR